MPFIFYILALVVVVSALMVVTRPNAVHSVMWLILTFFAVAALFILQGAEYLAAVQVLVYAGGIMVLFLFVIMLVKLEQVEGFVRSRMRLSAAVVLAGLLLVSVGVAFRLAGVVQAVPLPDGGLPGSQAGPVDLSLVSGNLEVVGTKLLTIYLLPFELVSVILLVAVVGAIVLARREA
ncbi:MAG: NADH-quinone oxidoreductase subunit J [Acidobacteria bacterium]|nr:MAG: NADH-quinone oxidoreductase subunit J [Acidobacteriota bacterium]